MRIDCTGLIFFLCLSLLTSSASFLCLVSIVIIVYLSISDYLHVSLEFTWGIICVGTVEEANEELYLSWCVSLLAVLLLLHMCSVPPSSRFVGLSLTGV